LNLRNGDELKAREAWTAARQALEVKPQAHHDDPRMLAVLAQIDAGLGRKEQADGPLVLQGLAQVYVWTGERSARWK